MVVIAVSIPVRAALCAAEWLLTNTQSHKIMGGIQSGGMWLQWVSSNRDKERMKVGTRDLTD
jgi:hypothetical protein